MSPLRSVPSRVTTLVLVASMASAQCPLQWLPGGGLTAPADDVAAATKWDPDGGGPLPELVVFGGTFTVAGNVAAANVVAYEPITRTWLPIGAGFDGAVAALHVLPNNDLLAGGNFTASGGAAVAGVARWNGSAWVPLGGGTPGPVSAITHRTNGDVVVGGLFTSVGGVAANNIASWNGTSWSPLGNGLTGNYGPLPPGPPAPRIQQLVRMPNGNLVASGRFLSSGSSPMHGLAEWNGSTWTGLGVGPIAPPSAYATIYAIAPRANGELVVSVVGSPYGGPLLVRGVLGGWTPLATPFPLIDVTALLELSNGTLVAAGNNSVWTQGPSGWTSSALPAVGLLWPATITEIAPSELIVAGASDGPTAWRSAAAGWAALSAGTDAPIASLFSDGSGTFAGGWFTQIDGVATRGIAERVGNAWIPVGGGIAGFVHAMARHPSGDLIAGGNFHQAGSVTAWGIARWNGAAWSDIGSAIPPSGPLPYPHFVVALAVLPNGDVIAGGDSFSGPPNPYIARWDGVAWSGLGTGVDGPVTAILRLPNGDLIVGGTFTIAGGAPAQHIARWNGTTWSPLGPGLGTNSYDLVASLALLPNGDLIAGGFFATTGDGLLYANNVARWNGAAWSALGAGMPDFVESLVVLPDGDVLASGPTTDWNGAPIATPRRWDGASWSTGVAAVGGPYRRIHTMALTPAGELLVGGDFASVQGVPSASFARLVSTCPALATPSGAGCVGAAGPVTLTAQRLPWLGSTFASSAATLPPLSFGIGVWGFGTLSIPLGAILPQGVPGCSLLVTTDVLGLLAPVAGVATATLPIPANPSLLGAMLHQQVVPFELDAAGAITGVTSSNALTLTIGAW